MKKKLTLCLLLGLFVSVSFSSEENISSELALPDNETCGLEVANINHKNFDGEAYQCGLGVCALGNLAYIFMNIYAFDKYLQHRFEMNTENISDQKKYFHEESFFMSVQGLLVKTDNLEEKKCKDKLYRFWWATYLAANSVYISKLGYKFYHWMWPSESELLSRKLQDARNRDKLELLLAKYASRCLKDNSAVMTSRCKQVFSDYSNLVGPVALAKLKESVIAG